ncbi:MAG: gliding motility-associated C-terminal domain-containing protein [Bacteroidales bacterium]
MKNIVFHILLFLAIITASIFPLSLYSQTTPELDAQKAVYVRVNDYKSRIIGDVDSVIVTDASGFAVEDTVLFYQTIGGLPDAGGEMPNYFYTGKYAIMKIQEINGNIIVFNSTLPNMATNPRQPGEIAQLVKIPNYGTVRVTSSFASDASYWEWNTNTKTGGVFPLIAKKLILETNLSANGQGFKGGLPDGEYGGVCSSASGDIIYQTVGMFTDAADSSGRKGESYDREGYSFTKGFENVGSGGGGGNGKYSGGGGGANSGYGSKGGFESESCSPAHDIGGRRGQPFTYNNTPGQFSYNRIFLGGGGGTGTQNPGSGRIATKGGDGGGIFILMVDTLIGNDYSITANGESVTALATAGAGGGGGGGVVVLDAGFVENTNFEVKGGNGGSVNTTYEKTGPGGAGGGGVVWYNNNIINPFLMVNDSAGRNGKVDGESYGADGLAANGDTYNNLILPLKGFIINPLPDDQVICEDEVPEEFLAGKPKGGDGSYSYQWLKSEYIEPDSFKAISGATELTFQYPDPLTKTTYFKRRVSSGTVSDETFYITVEVTPKINNNTIASNDTICQGLIPDPLTGTTSGGGLTGGLGEGTYTYQWQSRTDGGSWLDLNEETSSGYTPGSLNDTIYFRRIVQSGVCTDFSDAIIALVLPLIENNNPGTSQTVYCNNQEILPINSSTPTGGNGSYSYQWESKVGEGPWTPDVTTESYPVVSLNSDGTSSQTYQYRRMVYSGSENTCEDLSPVITLTVLPDITDNNVSVSQDTLCANLPTITISGSDPLGGDGAPYNYEWEASPTGTSAWESATGTIDQKDYQPGSLSTTRYFRRVVADGEGGVCTSTSNVQKITILPVISGNTISEDQDLCEGEDPQELTGGTLTGGTNNFDFVWQERTGSSGDWQGIGIESADYDPPVLSEGDDYFYRRLVFSGENNTCADTSESVLIYVESQIANNTAAETLIEECFGSEISILAGSATGGDGMVPVYTWRDSIVGGTWTISEGDFNSESYVNSALTERIWYRRFAISQSGLCSSYTDIILADTLSLPELVNFSASSDTICDDNPFTLYFDFSSKAYGPFEIEYTNGKETETATGISDSIYFSTYDRPFEGFDFQVLSIQDANNCYAEGDFSTVIPLWVNAAPSPEIVKPSDPFEYCGPVFTLESNPDVNPGVSPGWWEAAAGSQLTINSSSSTEAEFAIGLPFNTYTDTIFFKQSTTNCGTRSDALVVNLYEQPMQPVIFRGDFETIYITDTDTFSASLPTAGNFTWSLESEGANIENASANPVLLTNIPLEGETVLVYSVENGVCPVRTDRIQIDRRGVHVFEGISPENQDGLNDELVAEGLDVEGASFTFQIFANNGLLVRELNNEDLLDLGFETGLANNGLVLWDGTDRNGNNYVPDGTYYYVLTVLYKGREFVDKGFILVR